MCQCDEIEFTDPEIITKEEARRQGLTPLNFSYEEETETMEKTRNVSPEQAVTMVMRMLDEVEVKGHESVTALSNAMNLLDKIKEFVHEEASKPQPVEAKEESDG